MPSARFQFRTLVAWDRPATPADSRRSASAFRAHWDDTIALLLREVELLGGEIIAVQVDVTEGEIRRDGMLRARTYARSPGVKIAFDSRHGPLTYATDEYDHWQANVRAIALALTALRAVDRYGVTGSGEQYRGWTQITAQAAESKLTVAEAAAVLADASGIPAAQLLADQDVVTRAYRALVKVVHPDRGGDHDDVFRLITTARDVLLGGHADG